MGSHSRQPPVPKGAGVKVIDVPDVDWGEVLEAAESQHRRPPGTFTAYEFAERKPCSVDNARRILQHAVRAGTMERIRVSFRSYYRVVKP